MPSNTSLSSKNIIPPLPAGFVADTLPKLLYRNAHQYGTADAIREKRYGIWQTWTWEEYYQHVKRFALGLAAMGFKKGDKVAVIGDNRPKLYAAMMAAQSLQGTSMGVYQDAIADEVSYVIAHGEARFVVAEDQEQVDKLIGLKDSLGCVERVIFDEERGLEFQDNPWLIHFPEVQKQGDVFAQSQPDYFETQVIGTQSSDVALLSYTSGTTGNPKGVILSHYNVVAVINAVLEAEGWTHTDEMFARLPMAWIGDFVISVAGSLASGCVFSCPEEQETVYHDVREISPTVVFAPPRNWEALLTLIQVRMEESDWMKRGLYSMFMNIAVRTEKTLEEGKKPSMALASLNAVGDWIIRAPLRDMLGLRRMRLAYTGGAPLGPDVFRFLRALGVNIKQLYGLTETSAGCFFQPDGQANAETVGCALKGVEIQFSEQGEVLIKGPMVFVGYYKNQEATKETLNEEGWLSSGDAGFIDDNGHLKIIDRVKDVGRLKDSTLFAPQYLENKLKFSPYIREAVCIGHDQDYVVAMINIDLEAMENWAERNAVTYSGYQDLSQKDETVRLIHGELEKINLSLSRDSALKNTQIKRFLVLNKELDADDGEVTRTRKLRRKVINERYGALIDALYANKPWVDSEVTVTYEDGRTTSIKGRLRIQNMDAKPEGLAPMADAA